ncbi:MAG: helix-turn-helix domain-containing protein, partial [Pseudodonghicola sp.]|nr:helix-turn-helix domain-containing protein [Pseudodonghicola sp.]
DLSWWTGDRLGQERIALWVTLRIGSTQDTERALARAGWAMRRLASGPTPRPGDELASFLDRMPGSMGQGQPHAAIEDALADLSEVWASGQALHPITAAARLFHAWRALGPAGAVDLEAAVLAARHAALMARGAGQGALFLPLAQTGADALRGQGAPEEKLAAWLRGAERATLAALLYLDRVAAWRQRAQDSIADLSGRTPPALITLFEAWPQVSAPMAEAETGASRAAVQRNLNRLVQRGLIREITGQGRYRVWAARL